ncbi:MAG: T9SS type A sorting domain-containing protein [Bacteroidota bacterium]
MPKGPYTAGDNNPFVEYINLPVVSTNYLNCYRFEMFDSQGNGMPGGEFYLISLAGDTLVANSNGDFGATYQENFSLTWATDAEDTFSPQLLSVFPNPSRSQFHIQLAAPSPQPYTWELFDLHGRLLLQGESSTQEWILDLEDRSSGIYQFVLRSRDKVWAQKLYKQ